MKKIDISRATLADTANKVNEVIDCINLLIGLKAKETERTINFIKTGKYMTNEEITDDIKAQIRTLEYERRIRCKL